MKAPVMDDSRAMRKVIRGILHREGFGILETINGEEALDLLKNPESGKADLVTIDWSMPVMDGLELVVNIRAEKNLRNTTLIMVTVESEHSQIVCALVTGAYEYLIKLFTQEAISEKLLLLGLGS